MLNNEEILRHRSSRPVLDPRNHLGVVTERECSADHQVHDVSTVFLVGKECAFRCLMCDLWQYTLSRPTPVGALPVQIQKAVREVVHRDSLKLYNASNFFDLQAVPRADWAAIQEAVVDFDRLIVENHPKLTSVRIDEFQQNLKPQLEIALGLETADPRILRELNKGMNRDDFARACDYLKARSVDLRCFLVFQLPGVKDPIEDLCRSVEFAYQCGVDVCTIIPLRDGNGAVDWLIRHGQARLPSLGDYLLASGEALKVAQKHKQILLADTWDLSRFSDCSQCLHQANQRLKIMNMRQSWESELTTCTACSSPG